MLMLGQYTSVEFGRRCKEMKVRPSMGTVGDAYDNAMAESFFATLECELIDRRVCKMHTQAKLAIFTWIESWYNPHNDKKTKKQRTKYPLLNTGYPPASPAAITLHLSIQTITTPMSIWWRIR